MIAFTLLAALLLTQAADAHDAWLQANTRMVHTGNMVHVDLMFGNHGNDHRDFKVTRKAPLDGATLTLIRPDGGEYDMLRSVVDTGYSPEEGFWTTRVITSDPGTYIMAYTVDRTVHYAPKRTVKSAKTLFVATESLDQAPVQMEGHDRALGHPLEIVPVHHPIVPAGPGIDVKVQLLFEGEPLADHRVSFIPRGTRLEDGFDERYERMTDEEGYATFNPAFGNYYLIVAHKETDESGEGYDTTAYSATLAVQIPQACPCCAG